MTNIKALSYAGISSVTLALLAPSASFAGVEQSEAVTGTNPHSLVQRISHSLAEATEYTASASGYKWGKSALRSGSASTKWADSTSDHSGYKWGGSASDIKRESQSYAGASSYQWGSMNFSEQSGYRWGMNSFSEQSGYRWGMN